MHRLRILILTLHLLVLRSLAASVQYCHLETTEDEAIPFCMAVSTWDNSSTLATDLIVTFGYQRSSGKGWGAVGLGESMVPSLIFMIYGMEKGGEELVLSIRGAQEYREPQPSAELPKAEKLQVSLNSSSWLEASFACYGCGDWGAENRTSTVQPWIWAFSESQEFENATVESEVFFHAYTGLFSLEMDGALAVNTAGQPAIPLIDPSIPNQNLTEMAAHKVNIYSKAVTIHGSLLGLAMMILYPCAVIIIRSMPTQVRLYLLFQVLGSTSCVIGAAAIIYAIRLTGWVDLFKVPHALVGITVLLLLVPQLSLEYLYYRSSKPLYKSKEVESIRTWFGRIVIFGGCFNTIFGLQFAGFSTSVLLVALVVAVFDFVMILFAPRIIRKEQNGSVQRAPGDEDAVPLLEEELEMK